MNSALLQDPSVLLIGFIIITGLFLLSLGRMWMLSHSNRRMRVENLKMGKQAALQQVEVTAVHHDAMSWRAKTQRQFDALRSDLSHRLQQADQAGVRGLKELADAYQKELSVALDKISELEAALAAKPIAVAPTLVVAPAPLPKPPAPALPSLPAMETLRLQSLESELATAKAEIASGKQQNAALQRALLLARRRAPAPAMRKSSPRSTARNA